MERRHEDQMNLAIEQLVDTGWVYLDWYQVYRWYGAKRLSKGMRYDLNARIKEAFANSLNEEELPRLMSVDSGTHILLIREDFLEEFDTTTSGV